MFSFSKIKSLIKLYRTLYGKYKSQMFLLSILGIINGILGSIGVVALIPLLAVVSKQQSGQDNIVSAYVEKLFHYFNWEPSIKLLLIIIVAIFLFKAIVLAIFDYISNVINLKIGNEIRKEIFSETLKANWSYLISQKIGYLDYALNEDLGVTMGLLNKMYDFFMNVVSFLAYGVTALALSFYVTMYAVAAGGIILFFSKRIGNRIKMFAKKGTLLKRTLSHDLNETVLGLKALKTMRVEDSVTGSLGDLLDKMKRISLKQVKIRAVLTNPVEPIMVVFVASLFALSYKLPSFNFATFLVTVYLIQQLFIYTQKFQVFVTFWQNAMPSVERTILLKETLKGNLEEDSGKKEFSFNNTLEFNNVTFTYGNGKMVLKSLNFKIKKGEMVGIIGPSGMGKTTVADLLMRLLPPTEGSILLDGEDIREFTLDSWRRNIGYVSQDIFIKDGTIEDNIRLFDTSVSDEKIIEAAKSANIFNFIQTLSLGFKTQVGDRGLSLSTGQRQRIALARVLARSPQILILDEATSSLDNESETLIKQSIEKMRGKITVIIIAHRLTTVLDTDHLIALKDGRIEEEGAPKILLEDQNSYFHRVYASALN